MPSYVQADYFGDAWAQQLWHLFHKGKTAGPRGFQTREILGSVIHVSNGRQNILVNEGRDPNYKFMVAEWLWISLGRDDADTIARYNKKMRDFSDDGRVLYGAYGPRVHSQLNHVVGSINRDRETRQAVLTTWIPNPRISKDVPCTISMQFIVRDNRLHLIVTMRSSDIWLGLPYDFFTFSMIGNAVSGLVEADMGSVTLLLGSSHLYERDVDAADMALSNPTSSITSPQLPGWPPDYMSEVLVEQHFWEGNDNVWKNYAQAISAKSKKDAFDVLSRISPKQLR